MGCSHSDNKPRRRAPFVYNPFEVAVSGPAQDTRNTLVAALTVHFQARHRLGHVMQREPQMEPDTIERMGVSMIRGDGQHGLIYPEGEDDYLGARPLLDADLVLIDAPGNTEVPKLVAIGDGPVEEEYDDAIAYVGDSRACPVLPSHATYFTVDRLPEIIDRVDRHLFSTIEKTPSLGLVLAGGKSTRMGQDKGALEYHGKPQVVHCHELLSAFCDEVFVSSRVEQASDAVHAELPHIADRFIDIGPMGGILSALTAEPDAAWLVLACDLPYVTEDTLDTLVRTRNPFKLATAFRSANDGFPEPLCAIYEPKSVYRLMAFLARGYSCPRKVLINSDTHLLDAREHGELDNVNSPQEYQAAREALRPTT